MVPCPFKQNRQRVITSDELVVRVRNPIPFNLALVKSNKIKTLEIPYRSSKTEKRSVWEDPMKMLHARWLLTQQVMRTMPVISQAIQNLVVASLRATGKTMPCLLSFSPMEKLTGLKTLVEMATILAMQSLQMITVPSLPQALFREPPSSGTLPWYRRACAIFLFSAWMIMELQPMPSGQAVHGMMMLFLWSQIPITPFMSAVQLNKPLILVLTNSPAKEIEMPTSSN